MGSQFAGFYNVPGPISATATAIAAYNPVGGASSGFTQQTTQTGTTRLVLGMPPDIAGGIHDGRPFKVRAVGLTVSAVASNFTMALLWNCGANTALTTTTNDVSVATSSTQAVASIGGVITLEVELGWNSTQKQLAGVYSSGFANIPTTPVILPTGGPVAVVATNPVGVSSTAAQASLATIAGVQFYVMFTNSGAVTSTKLLEFTLSEL